MDRRPTRSAFPPIVRIPPDHRRIPGGDRPDRKNSWDMHPCRTTGRHDSLFSGAACRESGRRCPVLQFGEPFPALSFFGPSPPGIPDDHNIFWRPYGRAAQTHFHTPHTVFVSCQTTSRDFPFPSFPDF